MDTELPVWINFFAISEVFRLQAIVHDAAGSVKSSTYKRTGDCYTSPRFPSSCSLGHVSGLFFCIYVKIIALSEYALFDC